MNSELILEHLIETRRRSIILWKSLPKEYLNWCPDESAMTCIEMVRHVLGADHGWLSILKGKDMSTYTSPLKDIAFLDVENEIEITRNIRMEFKDYVSSLDDMELLKKDVYHPGISTPKVRGNYILRTAYHEAVHSGHFLSYLRQLNLERPNIWD